MASPEEPEGAGPGKSGGFPGISNLAHGLLSFWQPDNALGARRRGGSPSMMLYGIGTYGPPEGPQHESSASYRKLRPRFLDAMDQASFPPALPVSDTKYTVKAGDTLADIVRRQLQASGQTADNVAVFDKVREVAAQNHLKNANRLHVGQVLDMSALGGGNASPTPADAPRAALTPKPEIDVTVLPPLPQKSAQDGVVKVKPLAEAPSAQVSPDTEESPAPYLSGGGGRHAIIGPVAMASEQSPLLSPGAQGGPWHPLSRSMMSSLSPTVHYPTVKANGRPDLNGLLDQLLSPKASSAAAVVAPSPAEGAPGNDEAPWTRAVDAPTRLTSVYGARRDPFHRHSADFHEGIDLAAATGSEVHPLQPGTVSFSGWQSGYGRVVIVDHADGTQSLYGHNSKNLVSVGQEVSEKTVLAQVGATGRATGPHLHLEIRQNGKAVDPIAYLTANSASPTDSTQLAMNR